MPNMDLRLVRRSVSPGLLLAVLTCGMCLWSTMAMATITQGDFSIFGSLSTRESGRWGEGSAQNGTLSTFTPAPGTAGKVPTETGGSFDFNHWDLVQARQIADIRPDYQFVKNYSVLGRFDTLVLKNADFFAIYRGWYDAFPDIKHEGVAETGRDWTSYTDRQKQAEFIRDDLREYYGQLNFTDNFSMRVGKQQVIWSEADALSGTDVTNPADFRYHWDHFEAPEDLRENLRMVKFNYILPDFLKTTNNELEFFWIPGDWEHPALITNLTDARSPYAGFLALTPGNPAPFFPFFPGSYNEEGQPFRDQAFHDLDQYPMTFSSSLGGYFQGPNVILTQNRPSNSINNSEFGARYSTLLPIGNGLQTSLIWLYEARQPKVGFCQNCGASTLARYGYVPAVVNRVLPPGTLPAGNFFVNGFVFPAPAPGVPLAGDPLNFSRTISLVSFLHEEDVRQNYFDITGTYYDKDLTDIVYRYDFEYAPKIGINTFNLFSKYPTSQALLAADNIPDSSDSRWTEFTRWIIAGDRPTYIPWISKQHTFLTLQNTVTWYPDRPANAVPALSSWGKVREMSDFTFLSAVDWLMGGQLTALNTAEWDWDDNVGLLESLNSYRYSSSVVLGVNAVWYLGRSGRYTDPFALSRAQRDNEIEFRFAYEI
ncbi:MAG: hypothetical protein WA005_03800 [Candidatus Binataceae bacterium]